MRTLHTTEGFILWTPSDVAAAGRFFAIALAVGLVMYLAERWSQKREQANIAAGREDARRRLKQFVNEQRARG